MLIANEKHSYSLIAGAIVLAIASSPTIYAKSLTVTGTIETKTPKVAIDSNSTVVEAFVQPVELTFKTQSDSGCVLTGSESQAREATNVDSLTCYLEAQLPEGMEKSTKADDKGVENLVLMGEVNKVGTFDIPLTATFFSGSANTPVNIPIAGQSFTTVPPIPISVNDVKISSLHKSVEANEIELNTPNASQTVSLLVNTDIKPYDRTITIDDVGSCEIKAGEADGCEISLRELEFGTPDDRKGSKVLQVYSDASNGYFKEKALTTKTDLTISWDSRLPTYEGVAMGDFEGASKLDLGSDIVEATYNNLIFALKSPHAGRNDDWWHLGGEITLTPKPGESDIEPPSVVVHGIDYSFLWQSRKIPSQSKIDLANFNVLDDGYVTLDAITEEMSDGRYEGIVTVRDKLNNEVTFEKDISIQKFPNEALFFTSGRQHQEGKRRGLIFPAAMEFAVWSRVSNTVLDSVTVGGEEVDVMDVTGDGYHFKLKSLPDNLDVNAEVDIVVTFKDEYGTKFTHSRPVSLNPWTTVIKNVEAYSDIQRYVIDFRRTFESMNQCSFHDSLETAKSARFEYDSSIHCHVDFLDLPPDMVVSVRNDRILLNGYLDGEPGRDIAYNLNVVNKKGEHLKIKNQSFKTIHMDVPNVSVLVSNGDILEKDEQITFMVPFSGGRVADISATLKNADGKLVVNNPVGRDVLVPLKQVGSVSTYQPRLKAKIYADPKPLWTTETLTVKAGYDRDDSYDTTELIKMVYVPDENIRLNFSFDAMEPVINTKPFEIDVTLGQYSSEEKRYIYNKEHHGEWMIYTQIETKDGFVTVGDPVKLEDDGSMKVAIDTAGMVGSQRYRYRLLAKIISGYPDYEREIESRKIVLTAQEGGELGLGLRVSQTEGRAPLYAKVQTLFEPRSMMKAWGGTEWFLEKDNSGEWTKLEYDSRNIRHMLSDTGEYRFKTTTTNRFTGVTTDDYTDTILVYEVPEYDIEVTPEDFTGHQVTAKIVGLDPTKQYNVMWSEDKCATFSQTDQLSYTFTREEPSRVKLCTKVANVGTEQAERYRWGIKQANVRFSYPLPASLRPITEKLGEVNFESEFQAQVRLQAAARNYELKATWYTPTGKEIPTEIEKISDTYYMLNAKHTLTDEDLAANREETKPFYVSAELIGVDGTEKSVNSVMKVLKYRFPTFTMDIKPYYDIAPADASAIVIMDEYPEVPMEFSYEWLERDGVKFIGQSDRKNYSRGNYTIINDGLKEFVAIVKDTRGNEQVVSGTHLMNKAEPATIHIKSSYGNYYKREPLDVVMTPSIRYKHKKDRPRKTVYYVNGNPVQTTENFEKLQTTLDEQGEYEVTLEVHSLHGAVDTYTEIIEVLDNQLPECEIMFDRRNTYVKLIPKCKDHDGKVVDYTWTIPEIDKVIKSRYVVVAKDSLEGISSFTVELKVIDDAGEAAEFSRSNIAGFPEVSN